MIDLSKLSNSCTVQDLCDLLKKKGRSLITIGEIRKSVFVESKSKIEVKTCDDENFTCKWGHCDKSTLNEYCPDHEKRINLLSIVREKRRCSVDGCKRYKLKSEITCRFHKNNDQSNEVDSKTESDSKSETELNAELNASETRNAVSENQNEINNTCRWEKCSSIKTNDQYCEKHYRMINGVTSKKVKRKIIFIGGHGGMKGEVMKLSKQMDLDVYIYEKDTPSDKVLKGTFIVAFTNIMKHPQLKWIKEQDGCEVIYSPNHSIYAIKNLLKGISDGIKKQNKQNEQSKTV